MQDMRRHGISIKTRLLAICLAILLLTVMALSAALFMLYNRSYERMTYQNNQQTIEQLAHNIETYFDDLNRLILTTIGNTYLMDVLTAPPPQTALEKLDKRRAVESFLDDIMVTPRKDVINVFIIADEIYHGGRYTGSVDADADYESLGWYRQAVETGQRVFVPAHMEELLTNPKYTVFSFARSFQNPNSLKPVGVIKVDANTSGIQSICEKVDTGEDGGIIVVDETGFVLLNTFASGTVLDPYLAVQPDGDGHRVSVQNSNYIFNSTTIASFGWTVLSFTSTEGLATVQSQQLLLTVVVAAAFGMLTLVVLLIFTSGFLRPLLGIVTLMKTAEDGDLTVQYREKRRDEIGYLGTSFNTMITRINQTTQVNTQLITEIYEARALQNKARLHALQAQIKPHFMCNTLNMISMMVQSGQLEAAVENINRLSTLMRGLTAFDTSITLRQELVLLRAYLDIQMSRYPDRLAYREAVSAAFYDRQFPALLLQPVVENSVMHGCENNPNLTTVTITSRVAEDVLCLVVADDAGGMDKAGLETLQAKLANADGSLARGTEQQTEGHGLGLVNIHQRIRLYYGPEYGLVVDSRPEHGTTVTLRLPLNPVKPLMEEEVEA